MHADAVVYHNYFKSPNLALHQVLHIHLRVKRCRSVFPHGSVCLTGSGGGWPGSERLGGRGEGAYHPPRLSCGTSLLRPCSPSLFSTMPALPILSSLSVPPRAPPVRFCPPRKPGMSLAPRQGTRCRSHRSFLRSNDAVSPNGGKNCPKLLRINKLMEKTQKDIKMFCWGPCSA